MSNVYSFMARTDYYTNLVVRSGAVDQYHGIDLAPSIANYWYIFLSPNVRQYWATTYTVGQAQVPRLGSPLVAMGQNKSQISLTEAVLGCKGNIATYKQWLQLARRRKDGSKTDLKSVICRMRARSLLKRPYRAMFKALHYLSHRKMNYECEDVLQDQIRPRQLRIPVLSVAEHLDDDAFEHGLNPRLIRPTYAAEASILARHISPDPPFSLFMRSRSNNLHIQLWFTYIALASHTDIPSVPRNSEDRVREYWKPFVARKGFSTQPDSSLGHLELGMCLDT